MRGCEMVVVFIGFMEVLKSHTAEMRFLPTIVKSAAHRGVSIGCVGVALDCVEQYVIDGLAVERR